MLTMATKRFGAIAFGLTAAAIAAAFAMPRAAVEVSTSLLREPAAAAVAVEATTFTVDPVHSAVIFQTTHAGLSRFHGRFNEFDGAFTWDAEDPSKSSFGMTVQAASVDTRNANRDNHLRQDDFFSAKQFPTITFKSTAVRPGVQTGVYDLEGDLTLHGVTKPIHARLEWLGEGSFRNTPIAAFEATFTIHRSEFGMNQMVGPVGDEVRLTVAVEGQKQ